MKQDTVDQTTYAEARAYYDFMVWEQGMPSWENATPSTRRACYDVILTHADSEGEE